MSVSESVWHGPIRKDPLLSTPDMRIRKESNEYDDEIKQDGEKKKIKREARKAETTRKHQKFQTEYMSSIFLSYDFLFLK
jgi:hypothetical protein